MPNRFRRALLIVATVVMATAALLVSPVARADRPLHETGFIPVAVGTADEALLHYKVILPDPDVHPMPADGYPAVIDYSGYLPAITIYDNLDERFLDAGYAVVGINMRGQGCSSGHFDYFEPRQSVDGVEAIDWLATQEWSNGSFGMVGKSYPGISQLFVAGAQAIPGDPLDQAAIDGILADHLKAIVPGHVFADLYRDVPFPGGILNATFATYWPANRYYESFAVGPMYYLQTEEGEADGEVPQDVRDQCLENQADHATNPVFNPLTQAAPHQWDDDFWRIRSPYEFAHEIDTPMLLVQTWQDEQVGSRAVHILERLDPDLEWRALFTNGDHDDYYKPHVFDDVLAWIDWYLKGKGEAPDLDNRISVNWENDTERNVRWTATYPSWPVAGDDDAWRLHLTPDGSMSEAVPATPGAVSYAYVPEVGSEQRGGEPLAEVPAASWGDPPADGTYAAFTSPPLAEDKVLLGPASVDLWLSSTAADTDLEITVSEVRPDGQEMFVQQGWLRASRRVLDEERTTVLRPWQTHRVEDTAPLVPTVPELLRVEIFPFGHVFRAGSQLRVTVAAPHVYPDLWGFAALPIPAQNTIHTGGAAASSIALPLVPAGSVPADAADLPPCPLQNQPCRPVEALQ